MTISLQRGFTIIELMLFLAITGALFAALMIGVGSNIVQQQYREGVTSYSALLQEQYSEAVNVHNDRSDDGWACAGGDISQPTGGGQSRGTTNCMILGRAIQIENDSSGGTNVITSSVVGAEPATDDYLDAGDIASLLAFDPKIAAFDKQKTAIDWGSTLVTTDHKPLSGLILILRSPSSGLIREFATELSNSELANIGDLRTIITPAHAAASLKMCVNGSGILQPTESVTVNPRISGPDSITVNGMDGAC